MNQKHSYVRNNINNFAFMYRLLDIAVIQVTLILASNIYLDSFDLMYFTIALLANLSYIFFAEFLLLYRSWRIGSMKEILFYTSLSWLATVCVITLLLFFFKQSDNISRVVFAGWIVGAYIGLCGWRVIFRQILIIIRAKGLNCRSVGIIGLTPRGIELAREIEFNTEKGYRLDAIFDERSPGRIDDKYSSLLAGDIKKGVEMAKAGKLDILFIALSITETARINYILRSLGNTTVDVHIIPDLFTNNLLHARMGHVGNIQTISVFNSPMRGGSSLLKRMQDVILSLIILIVIAVPMLIIALAIKITSPGPVIFKQDRYGIDGKKIRIWKFRSMTTTDNEGEIKQVTKGDIRVTKLGAILRKTSLDELPQFFNTLGGSMSVVGPRPHAVSHNEQYREQVEYYMLRHKIKPGITGWAQVNGWRGETETLEKMEMRVRHDLDYIRNWSTWLDFKIIILTVFRGFAGKNVF